jgi:hypothetical protein
MPCDERHLVGGLLSEAKCFSVLQHGAQRQRAAAAMQLRLADPRSVLFNCAAPAWRQRRTLQAMRGRASNADLRVSNGTT